MSACNFTIPFIGSAEEIMQKAKSTVESQGGNFTGDTTSGNFDISIFGNTIKGSYTSEGQNLSFVIEEKPFLIPCHTIESFLIKQLS